MRTSAHIVWLLFLFVVGIIGALLLGLLAPAGTGMVFRHPALVPIVFGAVYALATLGRWKAQNIRLKLPWLGSGTAVDRAYQERWEREHMEQQLREADRAERWWD